MSHQSSPSTPPLNEPHYGIGFGDAVKRGFAKYAIFSGRASLGEYWWFVLFVGAGWFVLGAVGALAAEFSSSLSTYFAIVLGVFYFATLLPVIAVGIRRLHDAGHSGWYWFMGLIPIVGNLIVFVALVSGTRPNASQYGPPYSLGRPQWYPFGATVAADRPAETWPVIRDRSGVASPLLADGVDPAAHPTQMAYPTPAAPREKSSSRTLAIAAVLGVLAVGTVIALVAWNASLADRRGYSTTQAGGIISSGAADDESSDPWNTPEASASTSPGRAPPTRSPLKLQRRNLNWKTRPPL